MAALPVYPDSDFSDDDQSPLDVSFNKAAAHLRKITSQLNNDQLLELYGLFKQGTEGKCNIPKPGWLDGRGRKKWEAWDKLGTMPMDKAKEKYIATVSIYDPDCNIKQPDTNSQTEAWVAVSSLQYTPEPELDHKNLTLIDAAREDCPERVRELLAANPELKHEKDEDGLTALHWAADRDATQSLKAAIEGGCPLDAVDNMGQTALHYAASCGHMNATKILAAAGASLIKDEENCTPIDLASDIEIRKILEGLTLKT